VKKRQMIFGGKQKEGETSSFRMNEAGKEAGKGKHHKRKEKPLGRLRTPQ